MNDPDRKRFAQRGLPSLVRPRERAIPPEPPAQEPPAQEPPAQEPPALPSIEALMGRRPAATAPVTLDEARADPLPIEGFYAGVVTDCLERAGMLARHRDERPLQERPRLEARLLAQIDALAEAGATAAEIARFGAEEGEEDPWMLWAAAFALGAIDTPESIPALEAALDDLPDDDADPAVRVAEALLGAPNLHLPAVARSLLGSPHPGGRAAAIELLSRRRELDPPIALAALDHPSPAVAAVAIRALARMERQDAAVARLHARLDDDRPGVAWEAARALTLWRDGEPRARAREGALTARLGAGALEILVLGGELDDLAAMQAVVRRLPVSERVLGAVARFGHAGSWAYLLHYLGSPELADAARAALITLFGQPFDPAAAGPEAEPAAWRAALEAMRLSPSTRYRAGVPWSIAGVTAACARGDLPRREVELRLDEIRARTGAPAPIDLARWGPQEIR